ECGLLFFFSSRRRHTRSKRDWSSDVCSSDLEPAPEARPAPSMPRTGSETILVAEDDPAVRALASDMLREHGYTVLTAGNGEEALEVAERYRGPIHLLLTDVMMPRMNGLQLTGPFAAVRAHARVLYMTGYAEMPPVPDGALVRSEEHTSELQSRFDLVCRLLLEKK